MAGCTLSHAKRSKEKDGSRVHARMRECVHACMQKSMPIDQKAAVIRQLVHEEKKSMLRPDSYTFAEELLSCSAGRTIDRLLDAWRWHCIDSFASLLNIERRR